MIAITHAKNQQHEKIRQQTEQFLASGGKIRQIPSGVGGGTRTLEAFSPYTDTLEKLAKRRSRGGRR